MSRGVVPVAGRFVYLEEETCDGGEICRHSNAVFFSSSIPFFVVAWVNAAWYSTLPAHAKATGLKLHDDVPGWVRFQSYW